MDKNYIGVGSNLLILSLISRKDMYGYEIIKNLELLSENVFQFKEGTLYPILHRFENLVYVKSYFKTAENNKERKYYQITKVGLKQLEDEKAQWEIFKTSVHRVLDTHHYEFE